jgi:hypothetical protein
MKLLLLVQILHSKTVMIKKDKCKSARQTMILIIIIPATNWVYFSIPNSVSTENSSSAA